MVTGGAGYIGSHVVLALRELDYPVVILDDLSTGHKQAVPDGCEFVLGNAGDQELLPRVFKQYKINSVMHFAGSIIVEESVQEPVKYYENNTLVSLHLIESCIKEQVENFIFSSTAAVYGDSATMPADESSPFSARSACRRPRRTGDRWIRPSWKTSPGRRRGRSSRAGAGSRPAS